MKTLLLVTMILTSTFAFSETREEYKTQKLEKNKNQEGLMTWIEGSYVAISGGSLYLSKGLTKAINEMPKIEQPFYKKIRIGTRVIAAGALGTAIFAETIRKDIIEERETILSEIVKVENDTRNDREKVSPETKTTPTRKITSAQKD